MDGHFGLVAGVTAAVIAGCYVLWGPSRKQKTRSGRVPGILNLGNTCFLNAVLQGVAACPAFLYWLSASVEDVAKKKCSLGEDEKVTRGSKLSKALLHSLKVLNNQEPFEGDDFNCGEVIESLREHQWVISTEEQDAHEMFHVLSTTLEEELALQSPIFSLSDIGQLDFRVLGDDENEKQIASSAFRRHDSPFKGLLASQLMCRNCRHKCPLKYDTFDSLSLTIPASLDEDQITLSSCLRHFVKSELVSNVECGKCTLKSAGGDARRTFFKKLTIGKLPKCLCIHLHRTIWLQNGMPMKCFDHVTYPEVLHMDEFVYQGPSFQPLPPGIAKNLVGGNTTSAAGSETTMSPSMFSKVPVLKPVAGPSVRRPRPIVNAKHRYQLQAVIVHLGNVFSGHFVTYRRGPVGTRYHNTWYFTSDTLVYETTLSKVMESPAYVFFYERMPSATTQLTSIVNEQFHILQGM